MAATSADVKLRWPALNQVADPAEFTAALSDAALQVSAASWGNLYDLGVIHLAAHLLMVGHPEILGPGLSGPGPVSSEKVGEVARTYAVSPPSTATGYRATAPGREYLRLRGMLGLSTMVV